MGDNMKRYAMDKLVYWKNKRKPKALDIERRQAGRQDLADERIRKEMF